MGLLRLALTFVIGPPLFLLGAACAGASLAAQRGRSSLYFDIPAHFAPLWLAGGLVCALAALLILRGLSRIVIGALGLAAVAASGALMLPELTRSTGPAAGADAPGQLKIVQFNVWSENRDPERAIDWIVAQHPDIAVLEETTPSFRRLFEQRTGWPSVCRDCEVMIYSRRPFTSERLGLRGAPGPLAHATFRDAEGAFTVIGVHYAWPTDGRDQQAQEARLARVIDAYPRERTIVVGDFNSAPWSFSRRRWDAIFAIPRRDRALFTWPAGMMTGRRIEVPAPFLAIDHVYAGPDWGTVSLTRGPKLGSDHFPLVVTLAPVSPPPGPSDSGPARLQIVK